MTDNLGATVRRLVVFAAVCGLATFAMFAIFSQLRFEEHDPYRAEFSSVSGLKSGNFVRIAGVEVGKVERITITPDNNAVVDFSTDDSVVLTAGTKAVVRYADLIGGRYLALEEGPGGTTRLHPGQTIPLSQTAPALDLDALIGGFRPLFRALDPDQVNALSSQLISALQGQGATVGSILDQTAALTSALADRDELIGQVVTNLNTVLGSLSDQSEKLSDAIASASQLVNGLAARKTGISDAIAHTSAAAASVADLLNQARAPLQNTVHQTNRATAIVAADHEYVDNLLNTLPDAYRVLGRQGLNGDFFSFYLCDVVLKLNGKGGQPVYVKVAGQDTGRCTPR
ncbi:MCE family protein [Rhodococcus erythropolis]|uniref:MCE family protein n=1 Tax=Rhodococcus erythropolis TaxID=1833 RepID=UPI001C9A84FF|nr:MCE family protein [Rhodococcus erythropolis]MBY6388850.1 MCE family protein [Rhodococcus erythropolis]